MVSLLLLGLLIPFDAAGRPAAYNDATGIVLIESPTGILRSDLEYADLAAAQAGIAAGDADTWPMLESVTADECRSDVAFLRGACDTFRENDRWLNGALLCGLLSGIPFGFWFANQSLMKEPK